MLRDTVVHRLHVHKATEHLDISYGSKQKVVQIWSSPKRPRPRMSSYRAKSATDAPVEIFVVTALVVVRRKLFVAPESRGIQTTKKL